MRALITLVTLLIAPLVCAQTWHWARQLGGPGPDYGRMGALDSDGNTYVFGSYANPVGPTWFSDFYIADDTLLGSNEAYLAKHAPDGALLWARTISSLGDAHIGGFALDSLSGDFYITGSYVVNCVLDTCTLATASGGAFLAKWNSDGHCLWARTIATSGYTEFGGVSPVAIATDGEGKLFVSMRTDRFASTTVGTTAMPSGSLLAKYDSDGEEIWVKPFALYSGNLKWIFLNTLRYHGGRVIGHGPASIQEEGDTSVVDTIRIIGRQGIGGYALASIDPETGIAEWFRLDGFPTGGTGVESMDMDADGSIYCVGVYRGMAVYDEDTLTSTTAYAKAFISKYLPTGQRLFTRSFEGTDAFAFNAVDVDDDGNMATIGSLRGEIQINNTIYNAVTNTDMFVAMHDSAGNPLGLIHSGLGVGYGVRLGQGDLVVCGYFPGGGIPTGSITLGNETFQSHGYDDVFLAKHDLLTSIPQPMAPEGDRLEIYANPNRGSFRLRLPSALANERQLQLRIYDGTGHLVIEQQLQLDEERPRMDVWDVAPGFYMVTVSNGKRTYSGNMVVE